MFLVVLAPGWNSQRPELGKKWPTILQSNKCQQQARNSSSVGQDTQIRGLSFYIEICIQDHGRHRGVLFQNRDVWFPHPTVGLHRRSCLVSHPELLLEIIHADQAERKRSALQIREVKDIFGKEKFNWLAKLLDLNTCLQRLYLNPVDICMVIAGFNSDRLKHKSE